MSSVDFQKCKGGTAQASAMIQHMERHDGKDVEYANRWIDKERSHLNSVIGHGAHRFPPSSQMTLTRLNERVREIDKALPPKRVRKDRVTVVTLTVAAPEALRGKDEERFFRIVYDEIAEFCGGEQNVSCGYIHRDEIHDYIDTDGSRRTSRPHLHMAVIPFVDGVGVNGKAFETRARMRALNERIDQRCRDELHISFMTRQRGRTGRTVEELQAMSEGKAGKRAREELAEVGKALAIQKDAFDAMSDYLDRARPLVPVAVKERKTLSGKLKNYEVAPEDWVTIMQAFDEMRRVVELRDQLNKALGAIARTQEVYEQNRRNVDETNKMIREYSARISALEKDNANLRQAVTKVARDFPGFADALNQELRPAVEKLVEQYNRQYERQGGRRRDTGWER